MRFFVDANILLGALINPHGLSAKFIDALSSRVCRSAFETDFERHGTRAMRAPLVGGRACLPHACYCPDNRFPKEIA